jgi:bacterioferritin
MPTFLNQSQDCWVGSREGFKMTPLQLDVVAIRDSALLDMNDGAVTLTYEANAAMVIAVLNDVLASAVVSCLRYRQHAMVVSGINGTQMSRCFAKHAGDCLRRVVDLTERISQLGGAPNLEPSGLTDRSHTPYRTYESTDLAGMVGENLLASRIAIQVGHEAIRWIGDSDPTTRRLLERTLEVDEAHANVLRRLLD